VLIHRHVLTQHIALTSDNHLEFFSLTSWRRPYIFIALSQAQTMNPLLGDFSQVYKLRVRLHMAAIFHISQVCKLEDVSYSCIHQQNAPAIFSRVVIPAFKEFIHQFLEVYMDD
jgi:hypothetical protein